jgi:hypothetical protein
MYKKIAMKVMAVSLLLLCGSLISKDRKDENYQRDSFPRDQKRDKVNFPQLQPEKVQKTPIENIKKTEKHTEKAHIIPIEGLRKREGKWEDKGKDVRHKFIQEKQSRHIFDPSYWGHFRKKHQDWHFDNRFSWNRASSWNHIVVWLPGRFNAPYYYYYDDGGIYYSADGGSSDLILADSLQVSGIALANSTPSFSKNQEDWLSLGTFALSSEQDSLDIPHEYISLAISKEGAVTGAYVNVQNMEPIEIRGAIDQKSQRIAWKFVGKDFPVMETGLYNLTRKESALLVHLSSSKSEIRVIVQVGN